MKAAVLQHVPFEGPALAGTWLSGEGYSLSTTRLFSGDPLPRADTIDWLIIMGGPMGVADTELYPWLTDEKKLIESAIKKGKTVLGICLGAQLIAEVLGAAVYRNTEPEIGWFPVTLTPGAAQASAFKELPQNFPAFHWHGDTFDIPRGAVHTVSGNGCAHQAFQYGDRTVALQFHLESTGGSISDLVRFSGDDIIEAPLVQSPDEMAEGYRQYGKESASVLETILMNLAAESV